MAQKADAQFADGGSYIKSEQAAPLDGADRRQAGRLGARDREASHNQGRGKEGAVSNGGVERGQRYGEAKGRGCRLHRGFSYPVTALMAGATNRLLADRGRAGTDRGEEPGQGADQAGQACT